ncbi:hypothetical protein [Butyrivibrio proteoclasticus]|nr:hypothetical protein [Butyrivibrio proteoclasticus]
MKRLAFSYNSFTFCLMGGKGLTHSLLTVDDGLLTYHACPVDDRMTMQLN